MSYLLDTRLVAEVRKGLRCDPNVARWFSTVSGNDLHLSVLTLGELSRLVQIASRSDPDMAQSMTPWIAALKSGFKERILPIDVAVSQEWGKISAHERVAMTDGLLAATAKVHGLTLVSRNAGYLKGSGAMLLNPYENPVEPEQNA